MPYMLAPGARLYVGPHGQMEESLGACCAPCASGGPCATGLGATKSAAVQDLAHRNISGALLASGQGTAGVFSSHRTLILGGLAGVAALGVLYVVKRRRK